MGSFIPSKASICGILNFVRRGKCNTSAVNGDSICCTRASMETGAQTFTASFMWLSSCWMSWNRCSQDCSSFPLRWGVDSSPPSSLSRVPSLRSSPGGTSGSCPLVRLFSPLPSSSREALRCCCSSCSMVLRPL